MEKNLTEVMADVLEQCYKETNPDIYFGVIVDGKKSRSSERLPEILKGFTEEELRNMDWMDLGGKVLDNLGIPKNDDVYTVDYKKFQDAVGVLNLEVNCTKKTPSLWEKLKGK